MFTPSVTYRTSCHLPRRILRAPRQYSVAAAALHSITPSNDERPSEPLTPDSAEFTPSSSIQGSSKDGELPQTIESEPTPKSSSRKRHKTQFEDAYKSARKHDSLALIRGQSQVLTLSDFLNFRPNQLPATDSPAYRRLYNETVRSITRAFTTEQIQSFMRELELKGVTSHTKASGIKCILQEKWDMPVPPERKVKSRWPGKETVPITSPQLFLLLGKDGNELHELAHEHQVQIEANYEPLSLNVTGANTAIQGFKEAIAKVQKSSETRLIRPLVPSSVPDSLLQTISRVSGAFFHKTDNAAAYPHQIPLILHLNEIPLIAKHALHQSRSYALFPFINSTPLPWTMGHVSAYHMKKIGGWFSVGDFQPATRLEDGEYYDCAGNGVNLKSMLLDPLPEVKLGYKRIVSAQTGHILTSAAPTGNQMNFLPPIAGANPLVPLAKSVVQAKDGLGSRTFVGSAPPSITQGESFTPSSLFTRLVYRARPVLAKISEIGPKTPVAQQTLVFEVEHENTSASGERPSTPIMRCYMGTETRVDVALPDRPLDLSFKAFDSIEILSASIPKRLKEYARRLAQDKETGVINDPLDSFTYGTHQFYLDQSVMVEHSVSDTRIIEVTTDIDSQVKSSSCLIECTDVAVDESWRSFLRKCDHISSQPYHRPQAKFIPHVTTILD